MDKLSNNQPLNELLDNAVKHYSLLFTLPSYKRIILQTLVVCTVVGAISGVFIFTPTQYGFLPVALFSFSLFATTLFSNYLMTFILRGDAIYNLRRASALSLYSWILWALFILMGSVVAIFFDYSWIIKLCLLGFSAAFILRLIVLHATSSANSKNNFLAAMIQPYLCLLPYLILWWNAIEIEKVVMFSAYASVICYSSSAIFLYFLNRVGIKIAGVPSLSILKAFLLNWIADLNAPFESILEQLSMKKDVEVSLLNFSNSASKVKAVIAVSSVHPGPFKNIGSSLLPSMLKGSIEQKLSCTACTPLSLLGHELDVVSQNQSQKIIESVLESLSSFKAEEATATPFVKFSNDLATASCQIFGDTCIIMLSLAPRTTEDLPQELSHIIRKEAEKHGITQCIVVNAHNSIDGVVDYDKALEALKLVSSKCLDLAASIEKKPFKVGAATLLPEVFRLEDGMGLGGITAFVIEVGVQKAVYLVIDGNNMVSGLREKILSKLKSLGIDDGEVLTTDTHSVNALTLNARGYHPIGEVMSHEKLINHIIETVRSAMANLELAKFGYKSIKVPNVKVIGHESLEKLCMLPDSTIRVAKKIIIPLFLATFLMLFAPLLLI